jgi:large subunit ribosomal protein L1
MARKPGKQYQSARKQVEAKEYQLEEAVPLIQKIKYAKFDETVEVHMRLGVDPKHADQMVRGTVVMPNGLGKSKKVLVIASGDKQREATEAGADFVGGDDMVNKIQSEGWTDFDAVIATPDMMRSVGKLGKVLGPRGLMPNPKTGTVTVDVVKALREIKAGKVEFRVDKTGIIHAPVGKISFEAGKLVENAASLISAVIKAKPAVAKGKYVKSATHLLHDGPGRGDRHRAVQREGGGLSPTGVSMKKKEDKKKDIESLRQDLERCKNLFVTGYEKLRVGQDFELRKVVRGVGGKYRVVKNNLAERASEGTPAEQVLKNLRGMTSVAYTTNDPVALAKALTLTRSQPDVYLQGGDRGRPRDRRQGDHDLANMPSKEADLCEVAVPDQRPGAAAGDGDQRRGPRPGGGGGPGRERKQVQA